MKTYPVFNTKRLKQRLAQLEFDRMNNQRIDIYLFLEDFDNAELSEYDWMENMIEKVRDYNEEWNVNYDPKRTVENYLDRKKRQDK